MSFLHPDRRRPHCCATVGSIVHVLCSVAKWNFGSIIWSILIASCATSLTRRKALHQAVPNETYHPIEFRPRRDGRIVAVLSSMHNAALADSNQACLLPLFPCDDHEAVALCDVFEIRGPGRTRSIGHARR